MTIGGLPEDEITRDNFPGILAIGVQLVNHAMASCEVAIQTILRDFFADHDCSEDMMATLIEELRIRTSTPPLDDEDSHSE